MDGKVLCGASAEQLKYYFNPEFARLPETVRQELHAITVVMADRIGATFLMVFAGDGSLRLEIVPDEADFGYDEIDTADYPLFDYRPVDSLPADTAPAVLINTLDGESWHEDLPLDEFALDPADPADRMAVVRDGEALLGALYPDAPETVAEQMAMIWRNELLRLGEEPAAPVSAPEDGSGKDGDKK